MKDSFKFDKQQFVNPALHSATAAFTSVARRRGANTHRIPGHSQADTQVRKAEHTVIVLLLLNA